MSAANRLKKLYNEPFGPFAEDVILSERCSKQENRFPRLDSFRLERAGEPVGLDDTEFKPNNEIVRFAGILTIVSWDWLSPRGQRYLDAELQLRDIQSRRQDNLVDSSDLTHLKVHGLGLLNMRLSGRTNRITLTDDQVLLRVEIRGEKGMSAIFELLSSGPPAPGLLWSSRALLSPSNLSSRNRTYDVANMHALTMKYSERFFWRYSLLHLLEHICSSDPSPPPVEDRDIEYFVRRYLLHHAYTVNRPLTFTPGGSDATDLDSMTHMPRPRRHVSRAEVRAIFASQAEWILGDQIAKSNRAILNINKWTTFCQRSRRARIAAWIKKGMRWGVFDEEEIPNSSDEGDDAASLLKNVRIIGKDTKTLIKNAGKASKKKKKQIPQHTEASPVYELEPEPVFTTDYEPQHIYDPDFSEESSLPASPSSSESSFDLLRIDPEIHRHISPHFSEAPELPGADLKWSCPARGCSYILDLLDIKDTETRGMNSGRIEYLRRKQWRNSKEKEMQKSFSMMVSRHYEDHMSEAGITLELYGKQVIPKWTNPKIHQQWPPRDKEKPKEEERIDYS